MNPFNKDYRKTYNNHFRHGVLIGNYVEDIFGEDLKKTLQTKEEKEKLSEFMDKYKWPQLSENNIKNFGNDITRNNNLNLDLNIDFTRKNVEDYKLLQNLNPFTLEDKNSFLPSQLEYENQKKRVEDKNNTSSNISSETQNVLKKYHQKDTHELLYTKKSGLVKNLFFGHGMDQTKFNKNELTSTYQ